LIYTFTERDEVEDMLQLLAFAKRKHPEIEAVSSGAIASDYQRQRVEHVSAPQLSHVPFLLSFSAFESYCSSI
jgi:diphthamide synthase (EF-2-diphthine--ammonia ligase)